MASTSFSLAPLIEKLVLREDLSADEMTEAIQQACTGAVQPYQFAAFLVLLRAKGETWQEVASLVEVMRDHATKVPHPRVFAELGEKGQSKLLDIVGTGGDGHHTVNFSTAAAVLCAACGAKVAKHGNRSVSSKCGSADVLEELGIKMLKPPFIKGCIERCGIAFSESVGSSEEGSTRCSSHAVFDVRILLVVWST